MTRRHALVTGFDPFGGESVNPSWEAVSLLDGWECEGVTVQARQTPCVFGAAIETLVRAMHDLQPELVICVGQAGGRSEMSIERVALNVDDGRIADNAGQQPIDTAVVAGAPSAYFSTLPIKAIVRELRRAGIPAGVSNSAGTFVCNHLFFGLMHRLAIQAPASGRPPARGGFIHIPFLPEQAARHPGQPSMGLQALVEGLRVALRTALTVRTDVVETGGQLH